MNKLNSSSPAPAAKIVVTGPREGFKPAWRCIKRILKNADSDVVYVAREEDIPERVAGIIITGGSDIGPEYYGGLPLSTGRYDAMRDQLEAKLISFALKESVPIFCICRGMQLLNVVSGGSLHSRLDVKQIRGWRPQTFLPIKRADIAKTSKVSAALKKNTVWVNSLHWQAVRDLGKDLCIASKDKHGLVQSIEHESHPFAVGVQWHPEYLFYFSKQRAIFRLFLDAVSVFLEEDQTGARCEDLPNWPLLDANLNEITAVN